MTDESGWFCAVAAAGACVNRGRNANNVSFCPNCEMDLPTERTRLRNTEGLLKPADAAAVLPEIRLYLADISDLADLVTQYLQLDEYAVDDIVCCYDRPGIIIATDKKPARYTDGRLTAGTIVAFSAKYLYPFVSDGDIRPYKISVGYIQPFKIPS